MDGCVAATPTPPSYAVIFTGLRTPTDQGYGAMAQSMVALAAPKPGFLGVEAAREDLGITVSYWADLASIAACKAHAEHLVAQRWGREKWYADFRVRIALVERDYGM